MDTAASTTQEATTVSTTRTHVLDRFAVGTKVRGTYCGTPFTGTVWMSRGHAIDWTAYHIHVTLDTPTAFLGMRPRAGLLLVLDINGNDHDSTNLTCTLEVAA